MEPPCPHTLFDARVNVARIRENDDPDSAIVGFQAGIAVWCVHCNEPFHFLGVVSGVSLTYPTVSPDGLELRAPITMGAMELQPYQVLDVPVPKEGDDAIFIDTEQ